MICIRSVKHLADESLAATMRFPATALASVVAFLTIVLAQQGYLFDDPVLDHSNAPGRLWAVQTHVRELTRRGEIVQTVGVKSFAVTACTGVCR